MAQLELERGERERLLWQWEHGMPGKAQLPVVGSQLLTPEMASAFGITLSGGFLFAPGAVAPSPPGPGPGPGPLGAGNFPKQGMAPTSGPAVPIIQRPLARGGSGDGVPPPPQQQQMAPPGAHMPGYPAYLPHILPPGANPAAAAAAAAAAAMASGAFGYSPTQFAPPPGIPPGLVPPGMPLGMPPGGLSAAAVEQLSGLFGRPGDQGGGVAMPQGVVDPSVRAGEPGGPGGGLAMTQGMPSGVMPPGAMPPGATQPGAGIAMPPGAMPPGAMPPGMPPPPGGISASYQQMMAFQTGVDASRGTDGVKRTRDSGMDGGMGGGAMSGGGMSGGAMSGGGMSGGGLSGGGMSGGGMSGGDEDGTDDSAAPKRKQPRVVRTPQLHKRPATCHAPTGRLASCHAPTDHPVTCHFLTGCPATCHAPTGHPVTCHFLTGRPATCHAPTGWCGPHRCTSASWMPCRTSVGRCWFVRR